MTNQSTRTSQRRNPNRKAGRPRPRRRRRRVSADEATTAAVLVSTICTAIGSVNRMLGVLVPHLR